MDSIKAFPRRSEKRKRFSSHVCHPISLLPPFPTRPHAATMEIEWGITSVACPAFDPENCVNLECKGSGHINFTESSNCNPNKEFHSSSRLSISLPADHSCVLIAFLFSALLSQTDLRPNSICCRRPAWQWSWPNWANWTRTARSSTGSQAWCLSSCRWFCSSCSTRSWCWRCTGRSASADNSPRCAFHYLTRFLLLLSPDRNTRFLINYPRAWKRGWRVNFDFLRT